MEYSHVDAVIVMPLRILATQLPLDERLVGQGLEPAEASNSSMAMGRLG